jgi:tRNA-dihydrouridine synthase
MNKGFWKDLPRPIIGLSPMDGVTDAPMRFIAKKYGEPDVIYTEFVSVDGLWRIEKRGETTHKIWNELKFDKSEHPIVVQLFGSDPDSFYEATKIVAKMGFDGIDINMGCPSPGLEKRGGGAGLMRDSGLAHRVIEAVRKGVSDCSLGSGRAKDVLDTFPEYGAVPLCATFAGDPAPIVNNRVIPVSVKTRTGSGAPDPSWWKFLADEELPVVAIHGRTFKQLYKGEADWEVLKEAAKVIKESGALFLGNGDIQGIKESRTQELKEANIDGVLIGRAAVGNPWALRRDGYEPSVGERLKVALEHARKFEEINNMDCHGSSTKLAMTKGRARFEIMRKHLTWYSHGFDGAGSLRRKLVQTSSADEVEEIVNEFLDIAEN